LQCLFGEQQPESTALACAQGIHPPALRFDNRFNDRQSRHAAFLDQKRRRDCTVPIENTRMLADALSAAKLDVTYTSLAGAEHDGD
jgi:hypothetical protein